MTFFVDPHSPFWEYHALETQDTLSEMIECEEQDELEGLAHGSTYNMKFGRK